MRPRTPRYGHSHRREPRRAAARLVTPMGRGREHLDISFLDALSTVTPVSAVPPRMSGEGAHIP